MMQEISELEQKKLNTGRLFRAEADVVLPLLREQREAAVQKLIMHFRAGDTHQLVPAAAEISSIELMLSTISTRIKQAELIERKMHGSGT